MFSTRGVSKGKFQQITFEHNGVKVDVGMLNREELDEFAVELLQTVYGVGPDNLHECNDWFAEMLDRADIAIK